MNRLVVALAMLLAACTGSSPVTTAALPASTDPPAATAAADEVGQESDLTGRLAISGPTEVSITEPDGTVVWANDVGNPNSQPTWSVLGDLVYSDISDESTDLVVVQPNGSIVRLASPVLAFYLHWSPDGRSLGFLGAGRQAINFGVATPENQTAEVLDTGTPYYFDWNPDGTSLVAHVGVAQVREVAIASGDVDIVELTAATFQTPQWTEMGVILQREGRVSITASGLSSGLQSSAQDVIIGELGADGDVIATIRGVGSFSANAHNDVAVYQANDAETRLSILDAGGSEFILTDKAVLAFQWSPDTEKLAFLERVEDDSSVRWVIWNDGETVAFEPYVPSLGFMTRYQPFWDQYSRSMTIWSPGSNALVYSAQAKDNAAEGMIYIQGISESDTPMMVAAGDMASWSFTP